MAQAWLDDSLEKYTMLYKDASWLVNMIGHWDFWLGVGVLLWYMIQMLSKPAPQKVGFDYGLSNQHLQFIEQFEHF